MLFLVAVLLALPGLSSAFVNALSPPRSAGFISRRARATCPGCAGPEPERGSLRNFPCGEAVAKEPSLRVFHYGANMGCKKLTAIEVEPRSAQVAYIPGQCLRFGSAEGVPTSATEPAFGNLVPCADGCVHGMVHEIPQSQLSKISATESGYQLTELPEVIAYNGQRLTGVKAYIMQKNMTARAPSRRYGGLLYCTAREELAPAYAAQLSCELAELHVRDLKCSSETFVPLAAQSGSLTVTSIGRLFLATVASRALFLF